MQTQPEWRKTDVGVPAGEEGEFLQRRRKTDWAGIGPGDAFKTTVDYHVRIAAQRLFYRAIREIQIAAARRAGAAVDAAFVANVAPQIALCYTGYPSVLAAQAAIGLTGFLEYDSRIPDGDFVKNIAAAWSRARLPGGPEIEPAILDSVVRLVADVVRIRMLVADLAGAPEMRPVEMYRIFVASQQEVRFETLEEILGAVVLLGDLLAIPAGWRWHQVTAGLLSDLRGVSAPYLEAVGHGKPEERTELGVRWAVDILNAVLKYLPSKSATKPERPPPGNGTCPPPTSGDVAAQPLAENVRVLPAGEPGPPTLSDPPGALVCIDASESIADASKFVDPHVADGRSAAAREAIKRLEDALKSAGTQPAGWEDQRSDLVEDALDRHPFIRGPFEGNPTDGHEVHVRVGGLDVRGELFDRPVRLSDDTAAIDRLREEARPLTDKLKQALYPNVEKVMYRERFRATGMLDPARLALFEATRAVFQRTRCVDEADPRGRPVLLIACDGSASLNRLQMRMVKLLAAAWLASTARREIRVMAGLYHGGAIRSGINGPLVQWIHHPRKSMAMGHMDAIRAVAALSDDGTGAQADALSLAFLLGEACQEAAGRMTYLILISDCMWNRSFGLQREGCDEVRSVLDEARVKAKGRLHITLVALGVSGRTGLEGSPDATISLGADELRSPGAVVEQIGLLVATQMREWRKSQVKRQGHGPQNRNGGGK